MVEFTLLKLNVQDTSFTKGADEHAPEDDVEFEAAAAEQPPESGGSSKGAVLAALVGLAFLAVVAYLVKTRFLGDDSDEDEEYEFDSYD